MPLLIPEILFAIGKKLVEDGDSEAIIRFALSGKEPLKAMKNVYASVEYLKLCKNHYSIGWEASKCVNEMKIDDTHFKLLVNCIGNSVIDLDVYYSYFTDLEKEIVDKIIARKQLITFSFSANYIYAATFFINEFLPQFSSTLKHVSIPSECMTPTFRYCFDLDSLTITDNAGDDLPLFCCKTTSLTFKNSINLQAFDHFVEQNPQFSPHLSSIKQLTVDRSANPLRRYAYERMIKEMMKYFPSLELMKFIFSIHLCLDIRDHIISCINTITSLVKVPVKVEIEVYRFVFDYQPTNLDNYEKVCDEFELKYDQSISDFYCFRKNIQSGGPQSTILEVHFPK